MKTRAVGIYPTVVIILFHLKQKKKDDDRKSCSKTEHRDLAIIVSGFFVTEDGHKFEHCLHTSE